jgi:hypothetical protein
MATGRESHLPLISLGAQHALQPFQEPQFVIYKEYSPHSGFRISPSDQRIAQAREQAYAFTTSYRQNLGISLNYFDRQLP